MAVSQLSIMSGLDPQRMTDTQVSSSHSFPSEDLPMYPEQERPQLDMPPAYWDVVDVDEKGGVYKKKKN